MAKIPLDIEKKLEAVIRRIEVGAVCDWPNNEDFDEFTSVKSLAAAAGMSERSLRDWFKVYTGQKISRYAAYRRAERAARIFRLFPGTSKSDVARIIGLSSPQALYPFMRRNGVADLDDLTGAISSNDAIELSFRIDRLPDCIMFYTQVEAQYEKCSAIAFEADNWGKIDTFVSDRFPNAVKIGDAGYAIDRYVENATEEGIFISGVLYANIPFALLSTDMVGDIGWRHIPSQKYAVFTHKGDYGRLSEAYFSSLHTLRHHDDISIDKANLIMERYLNSPTDTPAEELITEIWVPVLSD